MTDLEKARRAKEKLAGRIATVGEVCGIAVTMIEGTYAVRVNLIREPPDATAIPEDVDGVPVVRRVVGTITKQDGNEPPSASD